LEMRPILFDISMYAIYFYILYIYWYNDSSGRHIQTIYIRSNGNGNG